MSTTDWWCKPSASEVLQHEGGAKANMLLTPANPQPRTSSSMLQTLGCQLEQDAPLHQSLSRQSNTTMHCNTFRVAA